MLGFYGLWSLLFCVSGLALVFMSGVDFFIAWYSGVQVEGRTEPTLWDWALGVGTPIMVLVAVVLVGLTLALQSGE